LNVFTGRIFVCVSRTALAYKGIDYEYRAVNLVKNGGEQVLCYPCFFAPLHLNFLTAKEIACHSHNTCAETGVCHVIVEWKIVFDPS